MKLYEFFNVPLDNRDNPKKIGTSKEEKELLSNEVFWYIIDNDDLHKEFVLPFVSDLKGKLTSPEFNKDRFTKFWKPMASKGCNLYHKKEKLKDNPSKIFDDEFLEKLCDKLAEKYYDEFKSDTYNVGDHKV